MRTIEDIYKFFLGVGKAKAKAKAKAKTR